MKTVYICEFTGAQFDNPFDCEVSEYQNGDTRQKFLQLINKFITSLQQKYPNIVVKAETVKVIDYKEFYIQDRIIYHRTVLFEFEKDGKVMEYYRTSDPVGDYRYNWEIEDTVQALVLDFEKEFIFPEFTIYEGMIHCEWENRKNEFKLDNLPIDYVLGKLNNKKIRIEILEDYNFLVNYEDDKQ